MIIKNTISDGGEKMKYMLKISGVIIVSFAAIACVLAPSPLLAQDYEEEEVVEEAPPPKKKAAEVKPQEIKKQAEEEEVIEEAPPPKKKAADVKPQEIKKQAEEEETMEEALPPRKKPARTRTQEIEPKKERPPFRFVPEVGGEEEEEAEESRAYKKRSRKIEEEEEPEMAPPPPPPKMAPSRVPVEIEEVGAEVAKEDYKFLVTGVVVKEGGMETAVEVTNQSGKVHSKLTVEFSFFDSGGEVISKQKMTVDVSKVSPNATIKKRFLIRNPPDGVAEVEGKVLSIK